MIKIKKCSELLGAEKFGSCVSCGCGSDEKEMYKLEFEVLSNKRSSLNLCYGCLIDMKEMIK